MYLKGPALGMAVLILLISLNMWHVHTQRTVLDTIFGDLFTMFKRLAVFGRTSEDPAVVAQLRKMGKTQDTSEKLRNLQTLCPDGVTAKRSPEPPSSVHRLRPGDIDIIGAMGDSLTAGNGMYSTTFGQVTVENRGRAALIGGSGTWRDQLTIPNILKEFNPELYGYALADGVSSDRSSKFNVGEIGAMSQDMPYMTRVLVKRMQRDPRVNMTHHWKLITHFVGANDVCGNICYYDDWEQSLEDRRRDLLDVLRYLRDTVPRLMVNIISTQTMYMYRDIEGLPPSCRVFRIFYCPCQMGADKTPEYLDRLYDVLRRWVAVDLEVAAREEFNTDTFTVNVLTSLIFRDYPTDEHGHKVQELLAADCFHFSAYGQAVATNSFWNNMLEKPWEQSKMNVSTFGHLHCPTAEHPYLMTRINSRDDFRP